MAAVNEMRLPGFSVCLQAQAGIMPLKGKCIPRVQRVVLITYSFRFDCCISFTFLKVNFQNIFLDNLFYLRYNNIQVVRLFLVYLYLFISAKNDCFYRFKAEFDVPAIYPLRCASCTALFL